MKRWLLLCLLLGCRKERTDAQSDPAATAPKRATCTISEEDPIVTKVEVPARCDLVVAKTRHIGPGGVLSIAPGAKLAFAKNAGIVVEGGALEARGTKEEPIVFGSASQQPAPGDWIGLRFSRVVSTLPDAGVVASTLEHFVVEYAGQKLDDPSAAILVGSTRVRLAHGRIRKNAAPGLSVATASALASAEDLVFTDNGGVSFDGDPSALASITASTFDEALRLSGVLDRPLVLPPAGAYVFRRVIVHGVRAPASLIIPDGAVVKFEKNGTLEVGTFYGVTVSTLVAKKVTFTSAEKTPADGDWEGLRLHDNSSATIEDAVVEYAGHRLGAAIRGGIDLPTDAKSISVSRTTFKSLAGPAFTAESCKAWIDPAKGNVYAGGKLCEEVASPAKSLGALIGSSSSSGSIGLLESSSPGFSNAPLSFGGPLKVANGKVRDVSVTTKGNLPNEVVRRILRSRIGSLRVCYGGSTVPGTIATQIDIDAKGNVSKVTKTGGTLTDAAISSCVTTSLSALSFPEPEGGTVTAQATWDFSPP